eukprot:scaffold1.g5338.t1
MWGGDGGGGGAAWAELAVQACDDASINCVTFDLCDEALWTGSAGGGIAQLLCPALDRYASLPAHQDQVLDLCSAGEAAVSVSAGELCVLASGGVPRLTHADEVRLGVGDLSALLLEHHSRRALVGRTGGGLLSVDLATGKPAGKADTGGRGVVGLAGPAARGAVVVGTSDGQVCLLDPRQAYRQEHCLLAHAGGFAALDARGEFVATAGYASRHGRLVFDVRMAPRMLSSLPFAPGPLLLRFHPRLPGTLLVGSASGVFCLADVQGYAGDMYQVEAEGDALVSCAISPTGECIAFGGSGGYVHLWAASEAPAVAGLGQVLAVPPPPTPAVSLSEDDPLVVDPELLSSMRQSDFVGYIQNPGFRRGAPLGEASRAVARQRCRRVAPQPSGADLEEARAERARRRAAAGGIVLAGRYKRVQIKQQTGLRFEEFDFSYYNRTPFTGLENDLANCYTNALLQVLFFTPPVREALLAQAPDTGVEFSLTDEMGFLFRMLATNGGCCPRVQAGGAPCQPANLLRCLRQSKEAAALGLLEGVKGERVATDIEVEANKDRSLSRRVQSLCRFLLEALNKEATAAGRPSPVGATFGLAQRQRTQCVSRPQRPEQIKEGRTFQIDLQYPPAKDRPPMASGLAQAPAGGAEPGGAAAAPGAGEADSSAGRPSFADLLRSSLKTQSEMRAWFDEEVKYQWVRQNRAPTGLPPVLTVNCGLQARDRGDLAWWQPVAEPGTDAEGKPVVRKRAWLPFALAITLDPERWEVDVRQGGCAEELGGALEGTPVPPGGCRAIYQLTALVSHVRDEDEEAEAGAEYEGHLVPPTYYEAQQQSSAGSTPQRPLSRADTPSDLATHAAAAMAGPLGDSTSPPLPQQQQQQQQQQQVATPPRRAAGPTPHALVQALLPSAQALAAAAAAKAAGGGADAAPATPPQRQLSAGDAEVIRHASDSALAAMAGAPGSGSTPSFRRAAHRARGSRGSTHEVAELYGGQKAPCLLFYSQTSIVKAGAEAEPAPPAPVLTPERFLQLCRAAPLQSPKVRLHRPTFTPLGPEEQPRPGMLFALDAEFVAYSPPEKVMRDGREVEARPSRLGLARVSVVRGEGTAKGTACVDDYIRSVEPVYDYLTKFSGLVPGDLDLSRSPHHLTTLKRAYTKLRYLVDCGCVFVGHGLKKDFRMINILVPPEQIIDTVDLFHAKRSRKLSLRFLASYLLQSTIQARAAHTHDSIEDACTALRIYDAEGTFEAKLQEMYDWGKVHSWEPVVWVDGRPQVAPTTGTGPVPLALGGLLPGAAAGGGGPRGPGRR